MWPFKRKARLDPGNSGFNEDQGTFRIVYERKPMPDPGAQNYAYESLGLVAFPPAGPSITIRQPRETVFPQMYATHAIPQNGIPLVAGQIFGQPLFDPQSGGFANDPFGGNVSPLVSYNVPASTPDYPARLAPNVAIRTRTRPGP